MNSKHKYSTLFWLKQDKTRSFEESELCMQLQTASSYHNISKYSHNYKESGVYRKYCLVL